MSYCRWSTDDFQCDLYVYEDCSGGWTIHVAAMRVPSDIPKVPSILECDTNTWTRAYKAQCEFLENCERTPIGLPFDGKSFNEPDLPSTISRLKELAACGYKFPDYVITDMEEEMSEQAAAPEAPTVSKEDR